MGVIRQLPQSVVNQIAADGDSPRAWSLRRESRFWRGRLQRICGLRHSKSLLVQGERKSETRNALPRNDSTFRTDRRNTAILHFTRTSRSRVLRAESRLASCVHNKLIKCD